MADKPKDPKDMNDDELLEALGKVLKKHKDTCTDPNCAGCA